jgi:hypothetical protein
MVWKELIPMIEFLLRRHPPPKFIVIQLGKRFTHLRVFSIDLPLLALCQYRLCNISDHTISVFGIKSNRTQGGGC